MKVLIVDDDVTNRMVLKAMLAKDGYDVVEAKNGQQAVDVYDDQELDLVLMDVMMPVLDGYQATRIIKEKTVEKFIPVIFLTAMTDEDSLVKCVESGGDDFLTKPYNRVILQAKIKALDRIGKLYKQNSDQKDILSMYVDRMERDQHVAEKIYSNLMGRSEKDRQIIEYLHQPADKFNGDLVLSLKKPGGGINLLVGDFTGHGLGAAIGALPAAEVFLGMTAKGFAIHDIIIEINSRLKNLLPTGMFLAAVLVDVDEKEQRVSIWNGGLPDMYVFSHKDNKISEVVASSSLPLGVVESNSLNTTETILKLNSGDSIIVHSDGVIETDNTQGEYYGTDRLEALIESSVPKDTLIKDVEESVLAFRGDEIQKDDLTVVQFKFDWEFLNSIENDAVASSHYKVSSSWCFNLKFEHDTLKHTDPVPLAIQILTEIQGVESHKGNLFTILSELIVNSLDHGVLGLCSSLKASADGFVEYYQLREVRLDNLSDGWINIKISNSPQNNGGVIKIQVSDSGVGFDFEKIIQDKNTKKGNSGRGLYLIDELSSKVNYDSEANLLEVIYEWE
ncbi:Serine phosphatase RsbU, regulator of sigma subunit / Serine-protein kinase RsbW [hydrothermal vent metagenome]|uniref:Serine phosphatase RsbU, regulator of sigma subunit / Serine-protein kinase RsbW n=1 Tax=hydrothermal vent metagenome TaxID=652676 RepID=A0A3B1A063_9ZZZZ